MRKRVQIALAVLVIVAVVGVIVWQGLREREPAYQGKRLTQWLDEYNRVGTLEQTEPISEAIRAIGTNSIPTLAKACQSTNAAVRTQAVLMLAMMKAMPPPWFSWGWTKEPLSSRPMFTIGVGVSEEDVREMVRMLEHPDSALRRASADAIGLYTQPPYAGAAKSSIPTLVQALNDADPDVRQSAGQTLRKIDPEAAAKAGVK